MVTCVLLLQLNSTAWPGPARRGPARAARRTAVEPESTIIRRLGSPLQRRVPQPHTFYSTASVVEAKIR